MITARRCPRRRRASALLFFLLVVFPAMFFVIGITSDISRVILINRMVTGTAETVAMAGASQFTSAGTLNQEAGRSEADITLKKAGEVGMYPSNVSLSREFATTPTSFTVTLRYRIDDLRIIGFFVEDRVLSGVVTRRSSVCNPVTDVCAYPI